MLWLLSAVSAALLVWYVGAPFRRVNEAVMADNTSHSSRRDTLELRRESLLRELKELEFDHRIGKIDATEYAQLRAETAAQASDVLRQLDDLNGERRAQKRQPVEARNGKPQRLGLDIEIEVLVARARRQLKTAAGWQCACGRNMKNEDRFCGSCGSPRPA